MKTLIPTYLPGILMVTLIGTSFCLNVIVEEEFSPLQKLRSNQLPLKSEEFQQWLEVQQERTVQKIMEKIASPNDTTTQHDAKISVARYLVNVTFTAMTRRLENYGKSILDTPILSENFTTTVSSQDEISSAIPTTVLPEQQQQPEATNSLVFEGELATGTEPATEVIEEEITTLPVEDETTSAVVIEETTIVAEEAPILVNAQIVYKPEGLPASGPVLPVSSPNEPSIPVPASSPAQPAEPAVPTTIFMFRPKENQAVPASSGNETEATTMASPIWQQILTFNFSSISGGGVRLPFNFSLSGLRGEGGNRIPFNLSLSALRGEGGNRLPFNFTLPTLGGGNGTAPRLPFNLSLSPLGGGEGGPRLPFNFSALGGGEGGPRLPFNFSLPTLGGEGGPRLPFNFSFPGAGISLLGGMANISTNTSEEGAASIGIMFNLPPPPDFNYPTPPPMNDSVRLSQMMLMSQVDKLVEGIHNSNLTGIVDSTVNIATPSTVGVLVNALLNLVLCNPLDRWHGNCGI